MQMYNDRPPVPVVEVAPVNVVNVAAATERGPQEQGEKESKKIPQPEISIIVDGNKVTKPGMKSVFIEDDDSVTVRSEDVVRIGYCSCNSVSVCTCNTVCTCETVIIREVCTCESVCSCVGDCSCNQVCTCQNDCSCDTVCTCNSQCTCQSVGGGVGCSCAPVH